MFGLGTWEIILILVVALIFIGPDKLPQVARSIGKGMRQVRSAMNQVDHQVRRAADDFVNSVGEDDEPPPAAEAAREDDDHPILRAPADAPKGAPPAPPSAPAEVAKSEAAPTPPPVEAAPAPAPDAGRADADADATAGAARDWRAHLARPVEGRVAAARPGRRPSTVIEDDGTDDADDGGDAPTTAGTPKSEGS